MPPFGLETILKGPPHPASAIDPTNLGAAVRVSAIGGSSTNDNVLSGMTGNTLLALTPVGIWITWVSDTDCYIHFQPTGATISAASSSNSMFLPAGVMVDFYHRPSRDDRVVMIQKTAGGNLYRWQSSI